MTRRRRANLDECIQRLLEDVDNFCGSSRAALELGEAARRGEDIEAAVGALGYALDRATQVGLLAEAATALILHFAQRQEPARILEAVANRKWGSYVGDALREGVVDLGPLLPGLLPEGEPAPEGLRPRWLLESYLEADPTRLEEVVALLGTRDPALVLGLARGMLPAEANRVAQGVLPLVTGALEAGPPALRDQAAALCGALAEAGGDLGASRAALRPFLRSRRDPLASAAAYALAVDAIHQGAWGTLDALARRRREALRLAAFRALAWARRAGPASAGADLDPRLARGLADSSGRVRELVLETLLTEHRAGRPLALDAASLAAVAAARDRGVDPVRLGEFLFEVGAEARDAGAPCGICLALPRRATWSYESDLPAELGQLRSAGRWRECPRCRAVYEYSYEEEWEDMSYDQTWSLRRLSPTECLATPEAPQAAWYRAHAAALLEEARRRLDHPLVRLREDAAWMLVEDAVAAAAWSRLDDLLRHPDAAVQRSAWASLGRRAPEGLPLEPLRAGLLAPEAEVRRRAAGLLSDRALEAGDRPSLEALLGAPDAEVAAVAVRCVDGASREGQDVGPYLPVLLELMRHPEERVRGPAQWTLARASTAPEVVDARLQLALENLASRDEDLQEEAARSLPDLARQGVDLAAALPHLVAMMGRRDTVWNAVEALARLAPSQDISPALPALVDGIVGGTLRGVASPEKVLWALRDQPEVLAPHLLRLTAVLAEVPEVVRDTVLEVVGELSAGGGDVLPLAPALEAVVPALEEYQREQLGKVLAQAYQAAGDARRLEALLRHHDRSIQWGSREVLAEALAEGAPVADHAAAVTAQLSARNRYHREGAGNLVRALLERYPEVRGAVIAELRTIPVSDERDALMTWMEDGEGPPRSG